MRDSDYFDYNNYGSEDMPEGAAHESISVDSNNYSVNEAARSATERFFESDPVPSDYVAAYERKRPAARTPKAEEFHTGGDWRTSSRYDADEEYMTRLADARRARQLRKEKAPAPNPAVRVNVEREHTSYDDDWVPPADEEFDTFRRRYTHDILSPPSEAEVRPRQKVPVYRDDVPPAIAPAAAHHAEGPSPLRYLLAIVFVGILGIMTFLVVNNRNLRRDLDEYQARFAQVEDNTADVARLNVDIVSYQQQVTTLREDVARLELQLQHNGEDTEYTPSPPDDTIAAARPPVEEDSDATTTPPPSPPEPEQTTHRVQQGDTLSRIANIHFGSNAQHYVDLISAANNITNPNNIRIDDVLIIPPRE